MRTTRNTRGTTRRAITVGATALALSLTATACGDDTDTAGSSGGSAITVATSSNGLGFLPIFVAIEQGLYEDAGLDVEAISVKGGSNGIAALAGGSAQFYAGLPDSQITASAAGSESMIIGALTDSNDYKIVASSDITSLDQLDGKKFGMLTEGNGTDIQPRWLLDETGVGSDNVEFIASGSVPDRLSALEADQVDATILNTPFELQAEQVGFNIVADFADYVPDYPAQVLISNPDVLEERPDDVAAFLEATLAGSQYIYDHTDEVVPLAAERTGLDEALVRDGLQQFIDTEHYSTTGEVSADGLQWAIDTISTYSDQDIPSDAESMLNLSHLPGGN